MQTTIHIQYNGETKSVLVGSTLADFITHMKLVPPFAVAINCTFIPRAAYTTTHLKEDDALEIVMPMQGG